MKYIYITIKSSITLEKKHNTFIFIAPLIIKISHFPFLSYNFHSFPVQPSLVHHFSYTQHNQYYCCDDILTSYSIRVKNMVADNRVQRQNIRKQKTVLIRAPGRFASQDSSPYKCPYRGLSNCPRCRNSCSMCELIQTVNIQRGNFMVKYVRLR